MQKLGDILYTARAQTGKKRLILFQRYDFAGLQMFCDFNLAMRTEMKVGSVKTYGSQFLGSSPCVSIGA